jgi:hypothetical protein
LTEPQLAIIIIPHLKEYLSAPIEQSFLEYQENTQFYRTIDKGRETVSCKYAISLVIDYSKKQKNVNVNAVIGT